MLIPGQGISIEIAFSTDPDAAVPAFEDVSSFVRMSPGIGITRGRSPEGGAVSPGTCTLTLDNSDGRFTPELTTSPYYPNVTLGRRLRVRYRDPANVGNLVGNSTFEVDTAGWTPSASTTLTASSVRAWQGSKSLETKISSGSDRWAETVVSGLVIGRTYTASGYVWVPAGNLATTLYAPDTSALLATTSLTNAWERLSITFTANAPTTRIVFLSQVFAVGSVGDVAYIDGVMVDEGTTARPFTSAAPDVSDRYTGFIDSWPLSWPSVTSQATTQISATDRLKRLAGRRKLRAVLQEEILTDGPLAYWPLSEDAASTTAGDVAGKSRGVTLTTKQYGAGGTLAFGAGTGPAADASTAPVFTPASASNGKTLTGTFPYPINNPGGFFGGSFVLVECAVATSGTSGRLVQLTTAFGEYLALDVSSTGKLRVSAAGATADSASNVNTGATRFVAVSLDAVGARAWMDGVIVATVPTPFIFTPRFDGFEVGGAAGLLIAATISNVAIYTDDATIPSSARLVAHATAGSTGFAGERSDQRVGRYLGYGGVAASDMVLDVGMSTSIVKIDTTGSTVVDAARRVEETENGILFVDRSGVCRFHARSRRYNATPVVLPASSTQPGMSFDYNDQGFTNEVNASREGGISYRAVDEASADLYGIATLDLSLVTTSDAEVVDAAEWRVSTNSTPSRRTPAQRFDLLSNDALRSALLALDVSSYVSLTGLPSQSAASSADLFVEGYTETITDQSWDLALNTSSATKSRAWQLGVAGASELGTTTRLTY